MVKIQHLNIFINITLLAWKYVMSLSFLLLYLHGTFTIDIKLHDLWTIFHNVPSDNQINKSEQRAYIYVSVK